MQVAIRGLEHPANPIRMVEVAQIEFAVLLPPQPVIGIHNRLLVQKDLERPIQVGLQHVHGITDGVLERRAVVIQVHPREAAVADARSHFARINFLCFAHFRSGIQHAGNVYAMAIAVLEQSTAGDAPRIPEGPGSSETPWCGHTL